ncbi:serine/threonine-protein kinase SMG1-like [Oppia nitens]|uniref:serine/threonine-protein kinase SMG1-like n=1 Tax=Oppia nitens TaxID=1686743 RepID=UPI0023D9B642|nr:serine/threonine-protein kinase SMG1-like [Oppia nitens]
MSYVKTRSEDHKNNKENSNTTDGLAVDMVYNYRHNNSSYNSRSFVSTQRRNGQQNDDNKHSNNSYANNRHTNNLEGIPLQKSSVSATVQSDLRLLRNSLRQFETGEKRLWPKYLQDLTQLFQTNTFPRAVIEKPGRVIDDVTRQLTRILTTKLFTDIIKEIIECMAAFSACLSHHLREFFNWMFDLYNSSITDETRIVLLKSLLKMIENKSKGLNENMGSLLNKLKDALEEAENIELLLTVTEVILMAAKNYPNLLQQHFRDVVDILIGWLLDSTQCHNQVMTKPLENALISLKQFWRYDMEFSVTLLGQFIEDFERFYQELIDENKDVLIQPKSQLNPNRRSTNENLSSDAKVLKMASLINIYVTVLKSLERFKSHDLNQTITWDFLSDGLKKIMNCVNSIICIKTSEDLVIATNHCSRLTLESVDVISPQSKQLLTVLKPQLLEYVEKVQQLFDFASNEYIISTLDLMKTVVKSLNTDLDTDFVTKVFIVGSQTHKLRFIPSNKVQKSLFSLHHSILSIKSVPILEESYRCLLSNMSFALSILFDTKVVVLADDLTEDFKSYNVYTEEEAIHLLQSCLVSLSEIANTKHSLIIIWALRPTLIDLVLNIINNWNEILSTKYKTIHYCLLYMLYSYSTKHMHFISNSSLIVNSPNSGQTSTSSQITGMLFNTSMTHHSVNNLSNILKLLNIVLKLKSLSPEVSVLCIDWIHEIIKNSHLHLNTFSTAKEIIDVIETISDMTFSNNKTVCLKSAKIIETVVKLFPNIVLPNAFNKYQKSCLIKIGHIDEDINKEYINLLAILPTAIKTQDIHMSSFSDILCRRDSYLYPEDIRLSILALIQREPSTSFTSNCFRSVVSFILDNSYSENNNWLRRWFNTCLSDDNPIKCSQSLTKYQSISNTINTTQVFDSYKSCQIYWSVWEVVQYCIFNRLRTPLGKPQDTFTKIEATIKRRVVQLQGTIDDSNTSIEVNSIQVRMLLLLMENIEKLVYNAIDGNSSRLYTTPKSAKSFFRTNKATCAEWITRNRMSVMLIALKCAEPATVVRHGQELLRELIQSKKQTNKDLELILIIIIEALIQLEAADAVMGYYIWAKQTLGLKYSWIKAAAEEASGHYENALDQLDVIQSENLHSNDNENGVVDKDMSSNKTDFLNNRLVQCYLNVGRFEEAINWSKQTQKTSANNLFNNNIDFKYLYAMSEFPNQVNDEPNERNNTLTNETKHVLWDRNAMYYKSQSKLFELCVSHFKDPSNNINKQLEELIDNNINPLVKIPILCGPSPEFSMITVLHRNAIALKSITGTNNNYKILKNILPLNPMTGFTSTNASVLVNAMIWANIYNNLAQNTTITTTTNSFNNSFNELNYICAKTARKQQNLKLSQILLLKYAANTCGLELAKHYIKGEAMNNISLKVNDLSPIIKVIKEAINQKSRSENLINFELEAAKLMYSFGNSRAAIDTLLSSTSQLLLKCDDKHSDQYMETMSRALLTLVKYLQLDTKYIEQLNISHPTLTLLLHRFNDLIDCEQVLGPLDTLVGKLLLFSVSNYPDLAKSWYALGAWSYRWGRKLSDLEEDKLEHRSITKEENAYALYKLSATSYFKFLHISGHNSCESVNATLRLLRLILKHANEMREILEVGLSQTPTEPWKNIILQLFSRLNHPEHYVRQSISDLLSRIGSDCHHLIVFPAVAGSLTNKKEEFVFDSVPGKTFGFNESFDDDFDVDAVINEQEEESALMQNCYAALVETLSQQNPQLISQTKAFVYELRRITVLWDELWIGTLMNHLGELKKQITSFETEVDKIKGNHMLNDEEKAYIIREKHNIFFRRVIYFLELTQLITGETPETPHEAWFQRSFGKSIADTIKLLQSPADPSQPQQNLVVYQQLLQMIQKKAMMASNGRSQLIMDNISPILASLENTVIPMPGLNVHSTTSGTTITIQRVSRTVTTLHTKTKPKKIVFFGSDGKAHAYLFKGHEDLHLDERIMQFLAIVNKMIVKYHSNKQENVYYRARHYSVTPLGNKSGLIQWVDSGQALYGFYKKWILNRDVSPNKMNANQNQNQNGANDAVYKPSDIFNRKLISKGIVSTTRSEWPSKVLVQVLQELMKETPIDLISKELWCASVNSYDYWRLTQTFTYSNALMSIIGYIIGLGDRHLDNILLDLNTGEVIHIDYNICFEKGKTLRVPEKVSCRLTQNIVNAFGITGIEGTFRMSCENILRVLRKGKETLLTLLEAFVYDPLIDWTPEHEEGYTGAIYGGARIAELANEGKLISKHQMEKENAEAIVRLNAKIKQIERQNNWPKISDDMSMVEIEPKMDTLEDITLNDTAIVSASRFGNVSNSIENEKSKKLSNNKTSSSVKRNTYATNVWKKVKMKLDGRDPDQNKKFSVIEQVNNVLKDAMDIENLALMYEGWTSWV